jgi:NADP-reducing hydrogenase subunit HndB
MGNIKSLEDLKRIREAALQKRQLKVESGSIQIIVGMGTTGIAAGARETMRAILEHIEQKNCRASPCGKRKYRPGFT